MASWYTKFYSSATSHINRLLQETDGDTEDDTLVCRALRSYYIGKGQQLPSWLPPDSKAPVAAAPAATIPALGSRYAGLPSQSGSGGNPAATSLSSLWDNGGSSGGGQAAAASAPPVGLRRGGGNMRGRLDDDPAGPRAASAGAGGPSHDWNKRLHGASRTTSPSRDTGPFQPPPTQGGGGGGGGSSGGGGSGDYEDRFAPENYHPGKRGGGRDPYGPGGSGAAPWQTWQVNAGGGGGGGRDYGRQPPPQGPGYGHGHPGNARRGLPSNPRMR